jgi:tetratricopeptide (TPR) repeat protein
MQSPSRTIAWVFVSSLLAMMAFANLGAYHYNDPFPPLSMSLSSPVATLSDFAGIALGFRKLTADVAWIQTLIYYGTFEEGNDPGVVEHEGGGRYPLFLAYCERVAQIDPNFKNVFYYGGGVLGWNLNRLDEAETLLKEGIQRHPKEWRFQQFLAGLAFQKNHNINKLVEFLEGFVEQPDCPNMLRSILANIYKKQKRYRESIQIWTMVYETGDHIYTDRALSQIREMASLAHTEATK